MERDGNLNWMRYDSILLVDLKKKTTWLDNMHVDVCMYNYSILYYNIENYIYDINIKILYMMLFSTKKNTICAFLGDCHAISEVANKTRAFIFVPDSLNRTFLQTMISHQILIEMVAQVPKTLDGLLTESVFSFL